MKRYFHFVLLSSSLPSVDNVRQLFLMTCKYRMTKTKESQTRIGLAITLYEQSRTCYTKPFIVNIVLLAMFAQNNKHLFPQRDGSRWGNKDHQVRMVCTIYIFLINKEVVYIL